MSSRDEFEKRLRLLIETGPLAAADAYVREAVVRSGDEALLSALDRPFNAMAIENWASIGADMEEARRLLPTADRGKPWQAAFVGLLNHSQSEGVFARIGFGLDAEPSKPSTAFRPSYMSDEQFAAFQRELAIRTFLPKGQRYTARHEDNGLRITGLDDLHAIECVSARDETQEERARRWQRQTLAAAIILLRFHQLIERYAADPGLPRPLPVFVYVVRVTWPMEQGISEFGIDATRMIQAAGDRFDHAAAAQVSEARALARRASHLRDTRRIIAELQEKQLALELWPRWRAPRRRWQFAELVRANREIVDGLLAETNGIETAGLSGDALARAIAGVRHPEDPAAAMEPLGTDDRNELHRIVIAFARKFGGGAVRSHFDDYSDLPIGVLDRMAKR